MFPDKVKVEFYAAPALTVPLEHYHVHLFGSDTDALRAWYVKHLSMHVVRSLTESPFTHFLADESGRVVVEMYGHPKAAVPNYAAMDPLVFHIAFVATDVAATRERLLAAGATSAGPVTTTPTGDVMTFMRDPWGVALQLVKRASALMG